MERDSQGMPECFLGKVLSQSTHDATISEANRKSTHPSGSVDVDDC